MCDTTLTALTVYFHGMTAGPKVIILLFFSQIEYDHSMTNGKIRDFCDGRFYKNHPLFSSNSSALQIMMYFDEFDVCDPLGSKSSKHKIGLYSYILLCKAHEVKHLALTC